MTLRNQVQAFYEKFVVEPARAVPGMPAPALIRLRLGLVLEEVVELASACGATMDGGDADMGELTVKDWDLDLLDLPAVADALADLDYVVEGLRQAFGIDGGPIADAVHAANMAKEGGGARGDGKIMKPEGWQPPDIIGCLLAQGWDGVQGAPPVLRKEVERRKEVDALRARVKQLEAQLAEKAGAFSVVGGRGGGP